MIFIREKTQREGIEPVRECFPHTVVNVSSSRTRLFTYVRMLGAATKRVRVSHHLRYMLKKLGSLEKDLRFLSINFNHLHVLMLPSLLFKK